MADNVWVIGVHMTKFGQHKDKDALDLGSEAGFSNAREVFSDPTGFYRIYRYDH